MWWYKLVVHWSKRDYIGFSLFTWILIFLTLAALRLVQSIPLELPLMALLSLAIIPLEFLIINIFQKYSSHIDKILHYPSLLAEDFDNEQSRQIGRILVFFYAEWCPFSRSASHFLASLNPISYKIFRVDLSDENNMLWASFKIRRIPTLIAFDNGKEFWRREATYLMGLRENDFNEADSIIKIE
jgi:thiol-disulfide isomerase/thioredoxin